METPSEVIDFRGVDSVGTIGFVVCIAIIRSAKRTMIKLDIFLIWVIVCCLGHSIWFSLKLKMLFQGYLFGYTYLVIFYSSRSLGITSRVLRNRDEKSVLDFQTLEFHLVFKFTWIFYSKYFIFFGRKILWLQIEAQFLIVLLIQNGLF